MAVAGAGLNGWDGGTGDDGLNKLGATARNDQVHQAASGDEVLDGIVGLARQELHGLARKVKLGEGILQDFYQLGIGVAGGFRAAQQRHVAGLNSQAKGVHGDVRAGLIDHAHHAERNAHLLHLNAVVHGAALQDLPYWVLQAGYLAQTTGNALHTRGVERQAVNKRLGHAAFAAGVDILLIGGENIFGVGNEVFGCALQDLILARRGQLRYDGRDFLGSTGFGQNFFAFSVAHAIPA